MQKVKRCEYFPKQLFSLTTMLYHHLTLFMVPENLQYLLANGLHSTQCSFTSSENMMHRYSASRKSINANNAVFIVVVTKQEALHIEVQ